MLFFLTDDAHEPLAAVRALPHGSVIIIRARNDARRMALAAQLKGLGHILLAADDPVLARQLDGIHLPEARAKEATHWRARHPGWIISVAAHNPRILHGVPHADVFLLSPVFATTSHPGAKPLTPARARLMARETDRPVIALGGVNADNAKLLTGFCGIAAISALQT